MNEKYDPKGIEAKWQKRWEDDGVFHAKTGSTKEKFYALVEFPYPSGDGLHVGHVRPYVALDMIARKRRMEGFEVLYPFGWDAFGLPTENYAVKHGIHPEVVTKKNTDNFRRQVKNIGISFDWSREINTTDPAYYKWTQWIFIQLFKKGLAYKAKMDINWCPSCRIGLANEEAVGGVCERCGGPTEKREKEQWMLAITKYADRLDNDLDLVDYPDRVKAQQRNWIGRSEGAVVKFCIVDSEESLEVFTTRVDTIFGCTYVVVAPEHALLRSEKLKIKNRADVERYMSAVRKKTEQDRLDATKEKTGVKLEGVEAVNPFTGEPVPVFVADYVLGNYGTGAVMAVPAHDERDWEFAKKYGLPMKQSAVSDIRGFNETVKTLEFLEKLYIEAEKKGIKFWVLGGLACAFQAGTIYRTHGDIDLIVKNRNDQHELMMILASLGFHELRRKRVSENLTNIVYTNDNGVEIDIGPNVDEFGLTDDDFEREERTLNGVRSLVLSVKFLCSLKELLIGKRNKEKDRLDLEYLHGKVFVDDGILVNSGEFTRLSSEEAREKMTVWLGEKGMGKKQTNYKLRDWVFSRQRYWGEPIPLVKCETCGWVEIPEKELPLELPRVESYVPTETGESPLAAMEDWVATTCPKCGGPARRETDTMPNWAGSSWYYLRYTDPKNDERLASADALAYWTPVDWYNGGMEHTTLHLLYSRFWHKFLFDIGVVPTVEPYGKRTSHGLILAEGGVKMSKSKGNVVNPDDIVRRFGADTLRVYEMFMGPFEQAVAWSEESIAGSRRFLEKVWKISKKVASRESESEEDRVRNEKIEKLLHRTIKKVSEDIDAMRFNTAVSSLMILANEMEKCERISLRTYSAFLLILSPFAPHLSEELWESLGNSGTILSASWPVSDPELLREESVEIAVQVNGKLRARLSLAAGLSQEDVTSAARADALVSKHLEGKEIRKVIFVQDRLVNFVAG